jgi:hypothetical protein
MSVVVRRFMPLSHGSMIHGVLLVLLLASAGARASLGGDAASVLADATALGGQVRTSSLVSYDVEDIEVAGGLCVREFLSRDGVVFALGWAGPAPPDLQQLLAAYRAEFMAGVATQVHQGLQRSVRLVLPDLVVQSGGHLRAYAGLAYLPLRLPPGVSPADIR